MKQKDWHVTISMMIRTDLAQAKEMTYQLHTLGWKSFQDLCVTITSEILGQTIQNFCYSQDIGRDGAFQGTWQPQKGEVFVGTFTIQCKFIAKPHAPIRLSQLKEEMPKAVSLAARGLASNYILMTNATVTAKTVAELNQVFLQIPGIKNFAIYGNEWITRLIRESARLRSLVPRVYGLGDLSQILDERAYSQAQEVLSAGSDEMLKFVKTHDFCKTEKAMSQHGFVLLLGEPASGKTTIASALALEAIDLQGYQMIKARDANDFKQHWNPHEPHQFFWIDDAFGVIQLDWMLIAGWNKIWGEMAAAVRRGTRILFTSRTYLYRAAKPYLKENAFPLLLESQVVISPENLSEREKEQILYNHIKLGNQPNWVKQKMKPFLPNIAANRFFSPEMARRLGNSFFTQHLTLSSAGIAHFVEQPISFLIEIIKTMDQHHRSALALIFMCGGNLKSPIRLGVRERKALELLGSTLAKIREAFNALNGNVVFYSFQEGIYYWRFRHPTIKDAFGSFVANELELLDIYLEGTPTPILLQETTCGDLSLPGVKVILPRNRYDQMIKRLNTLPRENDQLNSRLIRFLAYRCDGYFLKSYLKSNPTFLQYLSFLSSYKNYFRLSFCPEVILVIKLHQASLLPKKDRQRFVTEVVEITLRAPEDSFLSKNLRHLLTPIERQNLSKRVRQQVLPSLNLFLLDWRTHYKQGQTWDEEDYLNDLNQTLKKFKIKFKKDSTALMQIDAALAQIEEIQFELAFNRMEWEDYEKIKEWDLYSKLSSNQSIIYNNNKRSLFDDVDR